MSYAKDGSVTCRKAQLLISLYIENEKSLTQRIRNAFESHLSHCSKCLKEYEESACVTALVKKYWKPAYGCLCNRGEIPTEGQQEKKSICNHKDSSKQLLGKSTLPGFGMERVARSMWLEAYFLEIFVDRRRIKVLILFGIA